LIVRKILLPYVPCATLLYVSCERSKWTSPSSPANISKLYKCFWSTLGSDQVTAPHNSMLRH